MSLRNAFAGLAATAICLAGGSLGLGGAAQAADLVAAMPDALLGPVLTQAFLQPFTKATGIAVNALPFDGTVEAARAGHADLAVVDGPTLFDGCKSGAFAKLDWDKLGGRDRTLPQTASDCGAGAVLRSTVLSWNHDKFAGTPTWVDFWDVAKVPGKRGLHRGARYNLEIALLADGVAPGDIYSTLRTDAGIDRAFRKLDQLKPYVVWWTDPSEAPRLLASGDVLMTSASADRIVAAARSTDPQTHHNFALQWAGDITEVESWAILAASPNIPAATRLVAFAADPKVQHALSALGAFGSTTTGADDKLPPELLAVSPSAPANLAGGLMVDEGFWHDTGAKLDKQFDAWLAK